MNIVLFNDLTTEEILKEIENEGKKYEGLYVDMDNPPERKYVKEHAAKITDLIKKLDRARIDKSKTYKAQIEKEFGEIKERLLIANSPFSLLLDEYKEKRAKILADKKAKEGAIALAKQIEEDHEVALLMNKTYEFDKAEAERAKKEHEEAIAEQAAKQAIEQQRIKQEQEKQSEIEAENARLANIEHIRNVNRMILQRFIDEGVSLECAKEVIKLVAKNKIPSIKIFY